MRFESYLDEMYISPAERRKLKLPVVGQPLEWDAIASSNEEMIAMIRKNCAPFLKATNKMFFRGAEKYVDFMRYPVRQDRAPRDMPMELHEAIDDAFVRRFGWKARSSGAFACQERDETLNYGQPYMFFPIGNFKFVYSDVYDDIYGFLDKIVSHAYNKAKNKPKQKESDVAWYGSVSSLSLAHEINNWVYLYKLLGIQDGKIMPGTMEGIQQAIGDFLVSSYTDKNLEGSGKAEVSFQCKEYYLLHENFLMIIEKELGMDRYRG